MGLRFDDEYVAIPHGLHSPYPYWEITLQIERDLTYLKRALTISGIRCAELYQRLPFVSNEAGLFQGKVRGCNLTRPLASMLATGKEAPEVWNEIEFDEADWYFDWDNPPMYSQKCRCIRRRDPFDKRSVYKRVVF